MAASSVGSLEIGEDVDLIILTLTTLVKPPESGDTVVNILSSIENNLAKALNVCGDEKLQHWMVQHKVFPTCESELGGTWKFIRVCLTCLVHLKHITSNKEILISVNQKAAVKSCLQFVTALGISPFLKAGVGVSVESRNSKFVLDLKSDLSELDQLKRLSAVVRVLVKLIEDKSWQLYAVILPIVITDLLPALIQLSWGPNVTKTDAEEFRQLTATVLESLHQPTLIRELMVCLNPRPGPTKPPAWYVRTCSKLLTRRLLAPRGVVSTVRALHDLSQSEENQSKRCETTGKLLLGPHGPKPQEYYLHLCPQLLELMKSENEEYRNVAIKTVKLLWRKQPELCQQQILPSLWQPFSIEFNNSDGNLILEKSQEEEFCSCLQTMLSLTCLDGLPVDTLMIGLPRLCDFYLAIWQRGGTPQLRNVTKELLSQIMNHSDNKQVWKPIFTLPQECLLNLANDNAIANAMFPHLLHFLYETKDLEEKVLYCQLLMSLAEIPAVQKESLQKPSPMLISTIKSFLEDCDSDMVPVALLLLGTMVAECDNFTQYQSLVPALQKLRQSVELTESLRAIAEEIISSIATFGAVNMDKIPDSKKEEVMRKPDEKMPKEPTTASPLEVISFKQALEETQDSEIPTQGHGFLAFTKLIKKKDKAILKAQEQVFNLCLTGLQHEDSYVYLAAVGALSALTLTSLDILLPKVTQNYCKVENGPTLRTRLGETLLQVCKGLGKSTTLLLCISFCANLDFNSDLIYNY